MKKRNHSNKNKQRPVNNNPNAMPVNGANIISASGTEVRTCISCRVNAVPEGVQVCVPCQSQL